MPCLLFSSKLVESKAESDSDHGSCAGMAGHCIMASTCRLSQQRMLHTHTLSLWFALSFWTRNSLSNYNAIKIFKTKPLRDFFKEENELFMNFREPFNKFQKFVQESSGFSFSKLFADDLSKGELICLLV